MSTTRKPRKPKPPTSFAAPVGVPGLVRAASLALAIARFTKCNTWTEFCERVAARDDEVFDHLALVDLPASDAALIERHDDVLRLLQVKPLVSVAVCPECQDWVLVAGTAPTKCRTTLRGCERAAKPIKASIAAKRKDAPAAPA